MVQPKKAAQPHHIRAWREWMGWSQAVLSEKTQTDLDPDGISVSAISAYERSDDNPSLEALAKLARAIGIPRGMLLDVNPNDDPPLWASVLKAQVVKK